MLDALRSAPLLLALAVPAAAQSQRVGLGQDGTAERSFRSLALEHPCLVDHALFGTGVAALDFDSDGYDDLAVGAPGEGAVYIYFSEDNNAITPPFDNWAVFNAAGESSCPVTPASDYLGHHVAGADFDGDGRDELVAGAPHMNGAEGAILVFGLEASNFVPTTFRVQSPLAEKLGWSLATGDFDDDGEQDIASGAVFSPVGAMDEVGRVVLLLDVGSGNPTELILPNPQPVEQAFFGLHLATCDLNQDGKDDLAVSGVWNDSSTGIQCAGQVYVYPGPIDPAVWWLVEDDQPLVGDAPRYGMHLDARGPWLSVGSPRKDVGPDLDSGLGFSYFGSSFASLRHHRPTNPQPGDLLGFRTAIGDLIGGPELDITFISLSQVGPGGAQRRGMWIWDGANLSAPPRHVLPAPGSADHYPQGVTIGDWWPGGHEEIVLGDPTWDQPGAGNGNNTGRVVVYHSSAQ